VASTAHRARCPVRRWDVREDCLVIRARHAVFGAGGHHEGGKPTQIPPFKDLADGVKNLPLDTGD
jgi:hypothetical protein